MDINDLPGIIMVFFLVGLVLGVGIITFDRVGSAAEQVVTMTQEEVTMAGVGNITGQTGNSNVDNSTGAVALINSTRVAVPAANWTITHAGAIWIGGDFVNGTYNATYKFNKITKATVSLNKSVDAIKPIASDWMPLLVVVAMLAIIMVIVMRSFAGQMRR